MAQNGISKENIARFKKTHVALNEIYLLPGLLIPVSQETTIFIVKEELKKPQVIKRILNRKKETFVNNKGQTKHIAPPLRGSDLLIEIQLDSNLYSDDIFYERKQVTKYINLYLRDSLIRKKKRSLDTQSKRQANLEKKGWMLVQETPVKKPDDDLTF